MRATQFSLPVVLIALLTCVNMRAQTPKADSLRKVLSAPADTSQFGAYKDLCWEFLNQSLFDSAQVAADRFFSAGDALNSDRFRAEGRYFKGIALARRGGNEAEAVEAQTEALSYYEKEGNKSGQGFANLMVGFVYYNQRNYVTAETFWLKSRQFFMDAGDEVGLANVYSNLGAIKIETGDYRSARNLLTQALAIFEAHRKFGGVANCLSDLTVVCIEEYKLTTDSVRKKHLADSGLFCASRAIEVARMRNDQHLLAFTWNTMADYYAAVGQSDKALLYNDSAMQSASSLQSMNVVRDALSTYADIYEQKGDYRSALEYYRKWAELNDSISGAESVDKTTAAMASYEARKKAQEVEYEKRQAQLITIAVIIGLCLAAALAVVAFRAYRKSRKFSAQLADQNAIISQKNADITDSIQYSKRIQEALLPDQKQVRTILGDAFVLYRPKDIISGDFYWVQERDNKVFFMAADCTGHGVPGALMSMISSTLLNESVLEKHLAEAGAILDDVRTGIIRSLKQQDEAGPEDKTKDGMDGALCVFDRQTRKLTFAGAYNPLWVVRNTELIEIAADKFPVGISGAELKSFGTQHVDVRSGDMIYVFTDGFADQFGGPSGKKLKYSGFRKIIVEIASLTADEQQKRLSAFFDDWKGSLEQVDDVCVIGVRID